MTVLAVIPARGGSRGVPGKNLAPVGGVPLVARAVRESLAAPLVTDVVVSTDDPGIAAAARSAGARVVVRPAEIAGDTASSETAVLHAMDAFEALSGERVRAVLLVQCTSPFLTRDDVQGVAAAVVADGADSAVAVAPFHGFVWREGGDGRDGEGERPTAADGTSQPPAPARATPPPARGVNHDPAVRPRRQDRPLDFLETGAAYAMDATGFRTARHRFFGRTALVPADPARVLEVDDPHDLARARALAPLLDDANHPATATATAAAAVAAAGGELPRLDDIDAVVLDFDGTQTDDRVHIDADGRETVSVHRGDGLGIDRLRTA
ncbi:acylneuraminate cytidylyltransferase, partial [Streptomyces katsurahamanus]